MAYLLDTHALIWFLEGDGRLSAKAKEIISDDNASIYLSIASLWEMAIKISQVGWAGGFAHRRVLQTACEPQATH